MVVLTYNYKAHICMSYYSSTDLHTALKVHIRTRRRLSPLLRPPNGQEEEEGGVDGDTVVVRNWNQAGL